MAFAKELGKGKFPFRRVEWNLFTGAVPICRRDGDSMTYNCIISEKAMHRKGGQEQNDGLPDSCVNCPLLRAKSSSN